MTGDTVQPTAWDNAKAITVVRRPERVAFRRFLVFLVAAEGVSHPLLGKLLDDRAYDLAVRFYGPPGVNAGFLDAADYVLTGGLSKFHAAAQFLEQCRLIGRHEGVLFMDGDLRFDPAALQSFLERASAAGFSLAQPALSRDSFSYWKMPYHHAQFAYRETSFVEIMCPFLSDTALRKLLPTFTQSISGYGLDLVWPTLLPGQRIGVVDSFEIQHKEMVDMKGGPFYRYLSTLGIHPHEEESRLLEIYGVQRHQPHSRRGYMIRSDDGSRQISSVPLFGPERFTGSQLLIDRWLAICAWTARFFPSVFKDRR